MGYESRKAGYKNDDLMSKKILFKFIIPEKQVFLPVLVGFC